MSMTRVKNHNRRNKVAPDKRVEPERGTARVVIDFPTSGETIKSDSYTLRIGTPEGGQVEVAVDGGPWQACRLDQGYWWFDWSGYISGKHEAAARLTTADGTIKRGADIDFLVELTEE